jgi:hypothetical protein
VSNIGDLEKKLAGEIKLLQKVYELQKKISELLKNNDFAAADALQDQTDRILRKSLDMNRRNSELMKKFKADKMDLSPTVVKLNSMIKDISKSAGALSEENIALLRSKMHEIAGQIDHVRSGRKAMAGYQKQMESKLRSAPGFNRKM